MEVAFTLYKGFLVVEYSEADVRAYRNRAYYAGNIASYEASSQALLSQVIDEAEDQGDFTNIGYHALMQELGREKPEIGEDSMDKGRVEDYKTYKGYIIAPGIRMPRYDIYEYEIFETREQYERGNSVHTSESDLEAEQWVDRQVMGTGSRM